MHCYSTVGKCQAGQVGPPQLAIILPLCTTISHSCWSVCVETREGRNRDKEAPAPGLPLKSFAQRRHFQSRLSAREAEELRTLRWGFARAARPGPRGGLVKRASSLQVFTQAFLRERRPYSHGISSVKASQWPCESGELKIHLVKSSIVARPL